MEFLQILERKADGTAKWSEKYKIEVGFKENWVLDKTTDTAYVKFRYTDDNKNDEIYCKHPTWGIMDWCRILHVADENEPAKYDKEGLPVNFSEYVIGDIQANYVGRNKKWIINLKLEEPIVRAYGVLGETLTYTNQTSKTVDGKTYTREPYNHLTALERWLKVTPANCDSYASGYDRKKNISWYNRIKILDADFLRGIPFADDTFNELNLYNVLMDNYDSSTGRTPAFYFDMNTETDLPNNPARDEYLLKFLRQDGADKDYIESDKFFKNITAYQVAKSVSNYATGLASNVQNLSSEQAGKFPTETLYAVPEVNSNVRDTTAEGLDWVLKLPHKIKTVLCIKKMEMLDHVSGGYLQMKRTVEDITEMVMEERQFYSARSNDFLYDPDSDKSVLWYTEGDKLIHVKEYEYKSEEEAPALVYYVEYAPLVDARVSLGDDNFVQQVNQTASQVDGKKYSDYLQSYLAGMNVADLMIVKTYSSFDEFQDFFGRRIIKDGVEYLVTNVGYQNRDRQYDVVFQLNANHLRKNDSVRAPQTIRASAAIATENLKERKTFYKQTVRLSTQPLVYGNITNNFLVDKLKLLSALTIGMYAKNAEPQYAGLEFYWTYYYSSGRNETEKTETVKKKFLAPITKFRFGNQICFNVQISDNAEIGKNKYFETEIFGIQPAHTTKKLTFIKNQVPVLYTNAFGEVEKVKVIIGRGKVNPLDECDMYADRFGPNQTGIRNEIDETERYYKNIALVEVDNGVLNGWSDVEETKSVETGQMNIQKDMLEQFNLTLAAEIKPQGMEICEEMIDYSILSSATQIGGDLQIAFYASKNDKYDKQTPILQKNITSSSVENGKITLSFEGVSESYAGFAILKNSKKILIVNDIDDTIRQKIEQGYVDFYYD